MVECQLNWKNALCTARGRMSACARRIPNKNSGYESIHRGHHLWPNRTRRLVGRTARCLFGTKRRPQGAPTLRGRLPPGHRSQAARFSGCGWPNEEIVITELGQVGTQFDGFAHQTHLNSWYNCFKVDENSERGSFKKLGIHNVGHLMARGVLIDVAGYKGVEMLGDNYEITVEDLEGALKKQNVALEKAMRWLSTPAGASCGRRTTLAMSNPVRALA
jgi:hypothetical protein